MHPGGQCWGLYGLLDKQHAGMSQSRDPETVSFHLKKNHIKFQGPYPETFPSVQILLAVEQCINYM